MKNAGPEILLQLKTTVCCAAPWDSKEPVHSKQGNISTAQHNPFLQSGMSGGGEMQSLSGRCSLVSHPPLLFIPGCKGLGNLNFERAF